MRPQRTSSRFVHRTLFALAVATAASAALAPRAEACGMQMFYVAPRRNPDALLAEARRQLDQGRNVSALLTAKSVLEQRRATAEQQAEAWSMIGWVRWQRGQHASAVQAMTRSRELDENALDAVLLLFADTKSANAVRKALGA